jgi:hypothetical protein
MGVSSSELRRSIEDCRKVGEAQHECMVWAQPSDTSLRSVDLRALAEKSSSLRKAILLKAFPMMPANRRPYIDDCMVKGCCH